MNFRNLTIKTRIIATLVLLTGAMLGVAALGLAWRFLPADHRAAESGRVRFDVLGTLLLAGTLAAYALAMTMERGDFGRWSAVLLTTALLACAIPARKAMRVDPVTALRGNA